MMYYPFILTLLTSLVFGIDRECGCDWSKDGIAECSNSKNVDFACVEKKEPSEISLKANGYTSVPDELLQNCNQTRVINLSNNRIQILPKKLSDCRLMDYIIFDGNNITDPSELLKIDRRVRVRVNNMPMICDCNVAGKILEHTNAQKATVMCSAKRSGKQISVPYAKYCNEQQMNKASQNGVTRLVALVTVLHLLLHHYCNYHYQQL